VQSSLLYFNRSHTTPHIAFHQHHYHTDTALADHPLHPTTPSYPRRPLCHEGRPQSPQQPLQPLLAPHPTVAVSPFPIHPAPQSTGPGLRAATEQVDIETDSDDCSSILDLSVHRTPTENDGRSLRDSGHEDSSAHYTPFENSEDNQATSSTYLSIPIQSFSVTFLTSALGPRFHPSGFLPGTPQRGCHRW
jgi:hypothetical protein